ncbi:sperm-associated antigen 8 isoform X2 [Protopterus annectens]|uniref:sperm-associated antigen 8 isoform X2 n=1 Tax=Protopterus annectens TaxID=7888 RepID=UPI001CFA7946|nr:sperm-associated antigen 8 isoform X2 [Protopterus annectens]
MYAFYFDSANSGIPVNQRATADLDSGTQDVEEAKLYQHGHKGLLSIATENKLDGLTITKISFQHPHRAGAQVRGKREECLEQYLYQKISKDVFNELTQPPPPAKVELMSTTRQDYKVEGFKSVPPQPTMKHDYKTEQAITFWSENIQKVTGVTNIRTRDTPFKKNSSFSTPIYESMGDPEPHTLENYPNL